MKINRRKFVKASGSIPTAAIPGTMSQWVSVNANAAPNQNPAYQTDIEESIRAHFGPGFKVIEVFQSQEALSAKIEHLDNQYLVETSDMVQWHICGTSLS